MKNIFLFVTAFLISGSFSLEAEDAIDENSAAIELSEQLNENLETSPLNLKVNKLTMKGTQVSSEFADNLLNLITHELKRNTDDFPSVGALKRELTRGGLKVVPNKDDDNQTKDAFLEGIYQIVNGEIVIEMSLKDSSGKSVSKGEISLPITGVKNEWKPPNLKLAQESEELATSTEVPQSKDFSIELGLNKMDGSTFREGDNLSIFFRSDEDCYLLLLYQDVQGNHYILYPDTETQHNFHFKGGTYYDLFKKGDLKISCEPACGVEMIWAFASNIKVKTSGSTSDLNNSGFWGYPASYSLAKILGQQRSIKRSEKKAEARVTLTTVSKRKP